MANIENEEGFSQLREYVLNKGYKGAKIIYDDDFSEIVIYDKNIIFNIC